MKIIRRVVFRCGECRNVTGSNVTWEGTLPTVVSCVTCAAPYVLANDLPRGVDDETYLRMIREQAAAAEIDVPSACSVYEGIMTLEQAREPLPAPVDEQAEVMARLWPRLLGGIALVLVLAGLTVLFNLRIGPKQARAEVLVAEPPPESSHLPPQPEAAPPETKPPEEDQTLAVYKMDDDGHLTRVAGSDPTTVLIAYCNHPTNSGRYSPLSLADATPPNPGVRIGIMSDMNDLATYSAVHIWRDSRNGRWFAGGGSGSIGLEKLAFLPPSAEAIQQ